MLHLARAACMCVRVNVKVSYRFAGPTLLKHDRAIALYERPALNQVLRFVTRTIMPHWRK